LLQNTGDKLNMRFSMSMNANIDRIVVEKDLVMAIDIMYCV